MFMEYSFKWVMNGTIWAISCMSMPLLGGVVAWVIHHLGCIQVKLCIVSEPVCLMHDVNSTAQHDVHVLHMTDHRCRRDYSCVYLTRSVVTNDMRPDITLSPIILV